MALFGRVSCNCYRDGKTSEPPCKEYLDEDIEWLSLDIPDHIDPNQARQMTDEFYEWQKNACEYERMDFIDVSVGNIYVMSDFKFLLENNGGNEKFPVLMEHFQIMYPGISLPAQYAQDALKEIELLEVLPLETIACLKRKGSDGFLWRENPEKFVPFTFGKEHCYTVGKYDFCILSRVNEDDYIRFSSNNFTQQKINDDEYLFTDKTHGLQYTCCMDADSSDPDVTFKEFEVITTTVTVKEKHEHVLSALKKLLNASIQTNNRVIFY